MVGLLQEVPALEVVQHQEVGLDLVLSGGEEGKTRISPATRHDVGLN